MANMKILGVDVSKKSPEELRKIVEALEIQKLSSKSISMIEKMPKDMVNNWIENPESVGALTDDSVKSLYDSLDKTKPSKKTKKVVEKKEPLSFENDIEMQNMCYSEKASRIVHDVSKSAYDKACGAYETSIDRQAAHYDFFNETFKKEMIKNGFPVSQSAVDAISEQVAIGKYDTMRESFLNSSVEHDTSPKAFGGKFVVTIEGEGKGKGNYGTKLQSRTSDIADAVGETLGLSESKTQSVFISQSYDVSDKDPISPTSDRNAFMVVFTNVPDTESEYVVHEVISELKNIAPDTTFTVSDTYPITENDLATVKETLSNESLGLTTTGAVSDYKLPKSVVKELNHAAAMMPDFDSEQYNGDGFDSTGHSADGEYNAMYDSAYNDGPEM